ncbi:TspO/MBR family protein [Oligoflexus tunisiensis]|uniref:TspO/MBR family protein n=1 Tax=Oligoflexus tunisiensis TaxID=708132 RepID=UPI00114CB15F|nr:TspO/MBR family protein [Oligoflexus tunisiensis]
MKATSIPLSSGQSLAVALGGTVLAATLARTLAPSPKQGATKTWYDRLDKPAFQPPQKAFGPVWMALYASTAVGAWRILKAPPSPARSKALSLWTAQLGLNAVWSKLFFGERRGKASLVDSASSLIDSAALTYYAAKVDKPAALMFAPMVGWLALATGVNEEVWRRNPRAFRD